MNPLAYQLAAVSAGAAVICLFAKPIANRLQVFDYPRGGRKHHANPTPQVGGFAILLPVLAWLALAWFSHRNEPLYLALLLSGAGMGIVGVMDDQSHLSPSGRLLVVSTFTLVGFAIDPQLIAPAISWASFGTTSLSPPFFILGAVLATAGFVSSVNMADGIDGLVPAAFLIWCLGFDVFSSGAVQQIAFGLTGPAVVVLAFNLRGQVFLGDCGTFGIGFVFALLALASLRDGTLSAETLLVWFFLPVLDCVRVISARLLRRRSPLRGGKDHFHHILADIFGKRRAFYVYTATILVTSALAGFVPRLGIYILLAMIASSVGFVVARRALYRRQPDLVRSRNARLGRPRRTVRPR